METLASAFIYRHTKIRITTERPTEFIDLTESLEELLAESRIVTGFVNVQKPAHDRGHRRERGRAAAPGRLRVLPAKAPRRTTAAYRHDDETIRTVNLNPGERPTAHRIVAR